MGVKLIEIDWHGASFVFLPEHISGDLRIQRMSLVGLLLLLLLKENVVGTRRHGVVVQVQGALEESRTGSSKVRA